MSFNIFKHIIVNYKYVFYRNHNINILKKQWDTNISIVIWIFVTSEIILYI